MHLKRKGSVACRSPLKAFCCTALRMGWEPRLVAWQIHCRVLLLSQNPLWPRRPDLLTFSIDLSAPAPGRPFSLGPRSERWLGPGPPGPLRTQRQTQVEHSGLKLNCSAEVYLSWNRSWFVWSCSRPTKCFFFFLLCKIEFKDNPSKECLNREMPTELASCGMN